MNTALMTLSGPSHKKVMNSIMKKEEEGATEEVLFGSILLDLQGRTTVSIPEESNLKETKEKFMELFNKIEAMISNLIEQGEWSDGQGAYWNETIRNAKGVVSEGLFSKIISPMEELGQQLIAEEPLADLSEQTQELAGTFKELALLLKTVTTKSESSLQHLTPLFTGEEVVSASNPDRIEKNLHKTWQEMKSIIQTFHEKDPSPQASHKAGKEMKELLQKFMHLVESLPNHKSTGQGVLERITQEGTLQERQVFSKLIHMYQNRTDVPKTYHQQTPLTGKDIVKWVKQAMGEDLQQEPKLQAPKYQPLSNNVTMPMTKVEQHVIHMNQNQESTSSQKQMIQQLEKIIQSSRLLTNPKGSMEMLIKLKPGNLGDLTVKFAQVNGEMAVKILVTSQAAKEMLEGNKTQLRHMFSPQQVVIEKVESSALQQQLHEQMDSSSKDREQPNDHNQHVEEQDDMEMTENEELSFHEILMNEKV